MTHHTCSFERFLIGYSTLLLVTPPIVLLLFLASSTPVPLRATMSVSLTNISDRTAYQVGSFFYVRDHQNASRVRFFNITYQLIQASNGTSLAPIEDGSGFSLYVPEWHPSEQLRLQVDNINITSDFPINFSSLSYPRISYNIENPRNFEFSGILTVIGRTRFGTYSVASLHQFTYQGITQTAELRTRATEYSKVFLGLLYLLMLLIPLSIWFPQRIRKFPFATILIALSIVFLYSFVGSGREIVARTPFKILPFGFLMHAYDDHIFGNLTIFIPLSMLLEVWLHTKRNFRVFSVWYLSPIVFTSFLFRGIGFSITNEFFAWALWGLIIVERKAMTRLDLLLCLFSGVVAYPFFGWIFAYLQHVFSAKTSPWWDRLAGTHIFYGLIGATVFTIFTVIVLKKQAEANVSPN